MNTDSRPWMTALEMQFAASALPRAASVGKGGLSESDLEAFRHAETFCWSADVTSAVKLASRTIPGESRLTVSDLPSRSGWWWFESPIYEWRAPIGRLPVSASLYRVEREDRLDRSTVVYFRAFSLITDELRTASGAMGPIGSWVAWRISCDETLDEFAEFNRNHVVESTERIEDALPIYPALVRLVMAGSAWLKQRIVVISDGPVERHRRKQLARECNLPLPGNVKVIELRRVESSPHVTGEHESVDWSCRWVVGGHWRNQPYKEERKLIYILPYVKGPADKPLRVPTHVVYRVDR